jgi:hypothetical protein
MEMLPNIRYVVTKTSDDGTFEVGDHIKLLENGEIACIEAKGWIDAEDVPEATKGMECEIDQDYIDRQKARLTAELEALNKLQ